MPRLRPLFVKQPRVLDRDARLARQHAHQLQMPFVKRVIVIRENSHRPDRVVVRHQRHDADASLRANRHHAKLLRLFQKILANQNRLPRPNHILVQVISRRPRPLRHPHPVDHFQIEQDLFVQRIELHDIKILHRKQPPQLFPNLVQQIFFVQRRAQRAPDLVQHVQFFRPPRSLLHQITILDRHPDLMTQRQQQPQFRRRKSPVVRRPQQQHAKRLLLRLQTDHDHAAQSLRQPQLPKSPNRFVLLQRRQRRIAQIAKSQQPAHARHKPDQIIVEPFFLRHAAKIIIQSRRHHRRRPLRIAVMQKQRARRQSHHAQHAIQRLRQHPLNLSAHKTRRRQI